MDTIIHFRKNIAQPSFYFKKEKKARHKHEEASLEKFFGRQYITKLRETILKAKYIFFYKLKKETSGISFPHFCQDSNVRHFYPHNHKYQFAIKRDSLSIHVVPKISY